MKKIINSFLHSVSSTRDKVIIYGVGLVDPKTLEEAIHHVTSMRIDQYDYLNVVIENGTNVKQIKLTMEQAQELGVINVKPLINYC